MSVHLYTDMIGYQLRFQFVDNLENSMRLDEIIVIITINNKHVVVN